MEQLFLYLMYVTPYLAVLALMAWIADKLE